MNKNRWTDKEVKRWAKQYTATKKMTLFLLEDQIEVCHSTLWWCFTHRLEDIDFDLYEIVMSKLEFNKHRGGRKCQAVK